MHARPFLVFSWCFALATAGEPQERCCGAKEKAEESRPGLAAAPVPWTDYHRIPWIDDLAEAQRLAVSRRKMLFVFQLVGNLRDEPT